METNCPGSTAWLKLKPVLPFLEARIGYLGCRVSEQHSGSVSSDPRHPIPDTPARGDSMTIKKEKDPGEEILKLVEKLHEDRKIPRETILKGIESAIQVAAERHFGVESGVFVNIDQSTGHITAKHGETELDPETLGRIAAQSAKQMIIQKIREAESDTVFNEFSGKKGELVVGTVTRVDAGTAIVSLGKSEALLPRSEQIPGESQHVGDRGVFGRAAAFSDQAQAGRGKRAADIKAAAAERRARNQVYARAVWSDQAGQIRQAARAEAVAIISSRPIYARDFTAGIL